MANNHVEIHDPLSNCNDLNSSTDCDPTSTSDTDSMADTVEFRLLMAYAKRRRPRRDAETTTKQDNLVAQSGKAQEPSSPQTPAKTEKEEKKKRKKKGIKPLLSIFRCFIPRTLDGETAQTPENPPDVDNRCVILSGGVEEEDPLAELASRLTEIADEIPFIPPDVETDSPEDDVEKMIALLLREAGDGLNEKELKDNLIVREIFWNYSFFKTLLTTFLMRLGLVTSDPDALGPQASHKTQIAVTCEVIHRLSAVDTLPMNRMLDHGARYLQDHYSSWAQQQGGYEEAFYSDEEEE